MHFYQEITLIMQEEMPLSHIRDQVFKQLHFALVNMHNHQQHKGIGLSFPGYQFIPEKHKIGLGKNLRIFAKTEAELMAMNIGLCLTRLSDYVHISAIKPVPKDVKSYAVYQRHQVKSSIERLARRYAKRNNVTFEDAVTHFKDKQPKYSDLPYVKMSSESTDQRFKLLIHKNPVSSPTEAAHFTTYGLSAGDSLSTVPEF